jgi:hypothetical protein
LEKVSLAKVPVRKVQVRESRQVRGGSAERFVFDSFGLICLLVLVLVVIAFAGQGPVTYVPSSEETLKRAPHWHHP